ncbi:hypothetical protein STCU_09937 [Strigomonas culicis]|uniref:Uncharacterized protein n=1 Tax=Strigomonas culicis TaxID=28005 RepID=S9TK08_9TRYP|nr:hypothetical protein STCU_09937 [Strigomonas culicis]|eukprot:EPY18492.1 hypothetical protein STCU_09937 [Strigomonas culicis]
MDWPTAMPLLFGHSDDSQQLFPSAPRRAPGAPAAHEADVSDNEQVRVSDPAHAKPQHAHPHRDTILSNASNRSLNSHRDAPEAAADPIHSTVQRRYSIKKYNVKGFNSAFLFFEQATAPPKEGDGYLTFGNRTRRNRQEPKPTAARTEPNARDNSINASERELRSFPPATRPLGQILSPSRQSSASVDTAALVPPAVFKLPETPKNTRAAASSDVAAAIPHPAARPATMTEAADGAGAPRSSRNLLDMTPEEREQFREKAMQEFKSYYEGLRALRQRHAMQESALMPYVASPHWKSLEVMDSFSVSESADNLFGEKRYQQSSGKHSLDLMFTEASSMNGYGYEAEYYA